MAEKDKDTNYNDSSNWYWDEAKQNTFHKTAKNASGAPVLRYSQDDIFDRSGLIDDVKAKKAGQRAEAIKKSFMGTKGPTNTAAIKQETKDLSELNPNVAILTGANNPDADVKTVKKAKEITAEKNSDNKTNEGRHLFDEAESKKVSPTNNDNDLYKQMEGENEKVTSIFDKINDYYDDSLTGVYKNASDDDKRLYTADAILTTLKNISKAKPYIGSIYGRSHEGSDVGNEKSLLDKSIEKSLEQGLDRRNKRLNASLETQIMNAQLPSELKRSYLTIAQNNNLDYNQKKRLMDLEFQNYTKRGDYDVDKLRSELDVKANAPHRISGGVNVGPLNFGVN